MTDWKFVISALTLGTCVYLASAQNFVVDPPGVEVDTRGVQVIRCTPVPYPIKAIQEKIEDTVVANLTLNNKGHVTDAWIVRGPMELRGQVLASVLGWHFATNATGAQVEVRFTLPPDSPAVDSKNFVKLPPRLPAVFSKTDVALLPEILRERVLKAVILRQGQTVTAAHLIGAVKAARAVDEHIRCKIVTNDVGNVSIQARLSVAWGGCCLPVFGDTTPAPRRIHVSANAERKRLIRQTAPPYPELARNAGVRGPVVFRAVIGKYGCVQNVNLLSGHPWLVREAEDAVMDWLYRPTWVGGQPVEVLTTIEVDFAVNSRE